MYSWKSCMIFLVEALSTYPHQPIFPIKVTAVTFLGVFNTTMFPYVIIICSSFKKSAYETFLSRSATSSFLLSKTIFTAKFWRYFAITYFLSLCHLGPKEKITSLCSFVSSLKTITNQPKATELEYVKFKFTFCVFICHCPLLNP